MAVCQTPPCVWSWGVNSAGQLGHTDATTMPETVTGLSIDASFTSTGSAEAAVGTGQSPSALINAAIGCSGTQWISAN